MRRASVAVCSLEVSLDLFELFEQTCRLRVRDGCELSAQRRERLLEIGSLVRCKLVSLVAALCVGDHGVESLADKVKGVLCVSAARVEFQILAVGRGDVVERAAEIAFALAGQGRARGFPRDA